MEELLIPNTAKYDVATFNVLVNGKEVDPTYQLLSLAVSKEVNRVSSAKLIFRDGDASLRLFAISNKNDFIPVVKNSLTILS